MAYSSQTPSRTPNSGDRTKRPYEVIEEAERQWIYTEDELLRTPSIIDGLSPEEERTFRYKGFNFITQVGIMLKLPQTTISTATVFFNRFLMRYSLKQKSKEDKKLHHYQVAATALFLATKVEEHCRKVRELVIACCRVAQKNPNLVVDENTKDYWRWRDTILHHEDVLLEILCFDLTIESPYNEMFRLLQFYGVEKQRKLRDAAWSFINDTHLTQACLLFTSRTIACAAVWFAASQTGTQFEDDAQGRPWWETQRVPLRHVRRAMEYVADFYANAPGGLMLKGQTPGGESVYSRMKGDDGLEGTRVRNLSLTPALASPEGAGSEASANGKRAREEEDTAMSNGNGNGNGTIPVRVPNTNGTASRIPAAAREAMNGEGVAKRQKVDEPIGATNGTSAPAHDDAGSEEGEVEE